MVAGVAPSTPSPRRRSSFSNAHAEPNGYEGWAKRVRRCEGLDHSALGHDADAKPPRCTDMRRRSRSGDARGARVLDPNRRWGSRFGIIFIAAFPLHMSFWGSKRGVKVEGWRSFCEFV
jgi:hypothetical protein